MSVDAIGSVSGNHTSSVSAVSRIGSQGRNVSEANLFDNKNVNETTGSLAFQGPNETTGTAARGLDIMA